MAENHAGSNGVENETTLIERGIFRYHNGSKYVYGDPLAIEDRMRKAAQGHQDDMEFLPYESVLKNLDSDSPDLYIDATGRIVPIIAAGFKVKPLDEDTGEGLTRAQMLNLLISFFNFADAVKKNIEGSPNRSPSIDSTSEASEEPSETTAS